MSKKLYVGSLPYAVSNQDLERIFGEIGVVESAKVILGDEGRSKGFGFVEMADENDAKKAIAELNGATINDRAIVVSPARPPNRDRGGFGGSRGSFSRGPRSEGSSWR